MDIGGGAESVHEVEMLRTAAGWGGGFVKLVAPDGSLTTLHESGEVRLESGHWAFIGRPEARLDRWVASVKALDIVDGGMLDASRPCALRTSTSEWKLWPRLDPRAAPLEPLGRALQGAHQIALRSGPIPLVFALLPAAKVPRSGYWKADELLKARTPASH
jgi:hypothetical protein